MVEITKDKFKHPAFNKTGDNEYILYVHKSPSGKYYIGITCRGIERRWRVDGSGYFKCPYFYNAIKKYGWNNFKHFVVRMGMTKDEAEQAEIDLIKQYRENGYALYNISNGGNVAFAGIPLSEEHKNKISESNKGRPPTIMSEEGKIRLRESLKGNQYALGYHHTQETKEKLSKALKGRKLKPFTDEHKRRISESKKGKPLTENHKQRISEGLKGRKPSEKSIQRLIEYNKTRDCPENLLKKVSKPVLQYDINMNFIDEYPSATAASRQTGIDNSLISKCCNNRIKTAKGYIWKYKEDIINEEKYDVAM